MQDRLARFALLPPISVGSLVPLGWTAAHLADTEAPVDGSQLEQLEDLRSRSDRSILDSIFDGARSIRDSLQREFGPVGERAATNSGCHRSDTSM